VLSVATLNVLGNGVKLLYLWVAVMMGLEAWKLIPPGTLSECATILRLTVLVVGAVVCALFPLVVITDLVLAAFGHAR
jgi:hypothetical protein